MDSLFSIFLKWVNYSIFMAFSTASIIKPPFANFSLMALVFSLISLYCSAVIAGKISFKSSKESTQMPILFSSTKEAKAAFLQIIRGNRQRRYKEVFMWIIVFKIFAKRSGTLLTGFSIPNQPKITFNCSY